MTSTPPTPRPFQPYELMEEPDKVALHGTIMEMCQLYFAIRGRQANQAELHRTLFIDARLRRTRSGLAVLTHFGLLHQLFTPWGTLTFPMDRTSQTVDEFKANFQLEVVGEDVPETVQRPDKLFTLHAFLDQPLPGVLWPEVPELDPVLTWDLFRESQRILYNLGARF